MPTNYSLVNILTFNIFNSQYFDKAKKKSYVRNITTQLNNEKLQKKEFQEKAKDFGLKILYEFVPSENKKSRTSADFLCKITTDNNLLGEKNTTITVSLKTKSGSFTRLNSGTTLNAMLFKNYPFQELEKKLFLDCQKEVQKLRKNTSAKVWAEDYSTKQLIKSIYIETFYTLFNENKLLINHIYNILNIHQSDYVYTENKLEKTSVDAVYYDVQKVKQDTLKVGIFFLRIKASSSSTNSSWKFNVEV